MRSNGAPSRPFSNFSVPTYSPSHPHPLSIIMSTSDIRRRRDASPGISTDSLLTIIGYVHNVIINTLLSNGSLLRSHTNFAENAMFRPLQSVKDLMESFSAHLERWAHRIKVRLTSLFFFIYIDEWRLRVGYADVWWVGGM